MRKSRPKPEDIRRKSDAEKRKIYDRLDREYGSARLKVDYYKNKGFPTVAILIDGEPRYLTDILSLEDWSRQKRG